MHTATTTGTSPHTSQLRTELRQLFDDALSAMDHAQRPVMKRMAVRSRTDTQAAHVRLRQQRLLQAAPKLTGDRYLKEIRETLSSKLGLRRSRTQIKFHEAFINACSRFLYRQDGSAADMAAIMEREGWETLQQQVLCLTPRRFGKTTAVALFAGAVAMTVPRVEIAIFSTGRRASSKLLEQIADLIIGNNPEMVADQRVAKNNQESFWLSHGNGDLAKINSYPSAAKTLRGCVACA